MLLPSTRGPHDWVFLVLQVDSADNLQDMKKTYGELQFKAKGYQKRLDDLQVALTKHMQQYVGLPKKKFDVGRAVHNFLSPILCLVGFTKIQ